MELKEYLKIIKNNWRLFLGTMLGLFAISFGYLLLRPVSYATSLTLNITRSGIQNTTDYRYDLQADEKFTETVVQWLKSPRVEEDIYEEAGIATAGYNLKRLTKSISADKLSSQLIAVGFSAPNEESAKKIALAVGKIVSQNTQNLNKDQNESTWFEVISSAPVIRLDKINPLFILAIFFGSVFAAFWVVLIKHYLE
jgi:capsular polysaccharide biosynthesis protein